MPTTNHHLALIAGRWHFRLRLQTPTGAQNLTRSLGHADLPTARRIRDTLLTSIDTARLTHTLGLEPGNIHPLAAAHGIEKILDRIGLLRRRQAIATIAQLIAAYEADSAGRDIKPRSIYQAISCLRTILRTVHGPAVDLAALPIHTLTPQLLEDYKAAKIAATRDLGPSRAASARRTIASTARQAQSILAASARAQSHMRDLHLPDLSAYSAWKSGYTTRKLRQELDDTTLARLAALMDDLWFTDAPAWMAMSLAGNLGLRRGEATLARWSWVRMIAGAPIMYICRTEEASPKGNERKLSIDASTWADMCAHRTTSDYILPGETRETRDLIYDRTKLLLRAHGVEAGKPNHELRALQLQQAARLAGGMDNAQRISGHSDRSTLEIYTGKGTGHTTRAL